jgi:hypothetical protein
MANKPTGKLPHLSVVSVLQITQLLQCHSVMGAAIHYSIGAMNMMR